MEKLSFEDFKEKFGKVETAEEKKARIEKDKQEKTKLAGKDVVREIRDPEMKTDDPIRDEMYNKLKKMYEDKKTNAFVVHLLRAYLPVFKVHKVWNKPEDLKKFKCAVSDNPLISVAELLEITSNYEDFGKDFLEMIRKELKGEPAEHPLKKRVGKRVMGFTGFKTSTYLCQQAVQALYDLYSNKILWGDKQMGWLANDMMKKTEADMKEMERQELL